MSSQKNIVRKLFRTHMLAKVVPSIFAIAHAPSSTAAYTLDNARILSYNIKVFYNRKISLWK